ncbi:xanthine dehydrogenase small subunit [Azohydromonas caseinilytica]|uniref:Xanthine dehydrogenase small subunit n=1 Tax=Azohydromonas caseinilytica TaxID=2728836 RepID=A0A848F6M7_9BURK|nr:xanthine dehydrogenase small subunit [Azohydromonas caseinilytica]NML14818.1 xanthine dehydrogenase small subunit [Azohydromonas caseinilytica]
MNTPRPIRFFHRGRTVSVDASTPTRTVLQWLREDEACTGTKEGCNEGDCGACTVLVGELADGPGPDVVGGLRLRSVNACIRFLPTLDGKALLTVEDLKPAAGGALHPVQQALVDCHGSQCGFCTPGFAMSLTACYERHCEAGTRPTRQELADELSGNLCRCTGYRPILDAGQKMFDLGTVRLDTAPIVQALQSLQAEPALSLPGFEAPRTLDDLAALRQAQPQATLLAGATDIGLWNNKQFRPLPQLLYVGEVKELQRIEEMDGGLRIGAGASLEDAWTALADAVPELREVWLRFASPPVRHAGTLGGNVANGSPIGDGAPVLIALGATLVLRQGERERRLPLRDFYVDYMKNRLEPGEFLQAIEVPRPAPDAAVRVWKISKRYDSDISAVCGAFLLALDGGRVREARFVFGGMAAIVKHAAHAEAAVVGQPWTEATARAAMDALTRDFTPLTDQRASADYRLRVAQNLLLKLWLQTRPEAPLPVAAGSVWQAA